MHPHDVVDFGFSNKHGINTKGAQFIRFAKVSHAYLLILSNTYYFSITYAKFSTPSKVTLAEFAYLNKTLKEL